MSSNIPVMQKLGMFKKLHDFKTVDVGPITAFIRCVLINIYDSISVAFWMKFSSSKEKNNFSSLSLNGLNGWSLILNFIF